MTDKPTLTVPAAYLDTWRGALFDLFREYAGWFEDEQEKLENEVVLRDDDNDNSPRLGELPRTEDDIGELAALWSQVPGREARMGAGFHGSLDAMWNVLQVAVRRSTARLTVNVKCEPIHPGDVRTALAELDFWLGHYERVEAARLAQAEQIKRKAA